ncbi:MAG: hypothetical protein ABII00_16815 [Elusimicrobiota bacterium]
MEAERDRQQRAWLKDRQEKSRDEPDDKQERRDDPPSRQKGLKWTEPAVIE